MSAGRPKRAYGSRDGRPSDSNRPKRSSDSERPGRTYGSRDGRPFDSERPKRAYSSDRPKRTYGDRDDKPFDRDRKPFDRDRKPFDGERPKRAYSSDRPKRAYGSRDDKPFDRDRKPFDRDRKPFDGERPKRAYSSDRPKRAYGSRDDKPFDRDRKPFDRDRKPFDGERPKRAYSSDRPKRAYGSRDDKPFDRDRKPFDRDRKPFDGERPKRAYSSDRPKRAYGSRDDKPFDRDRKPFDRDSKPFDRDRKPFDGERTERAFDSDRPKRKFEKSTEPFESDRPKRSFGEDHAERPQRDYRPKAEAYTPKPRRRKAVDEEGIRLNKFIANSGVCSRREADEYIIAGLVSVNGQIITELGTKIQAQDDVRFNGERLRGEEKVYLLMNKPKDFVTTLSDPNAEKTVMDLISGNCSQRVYPVGRLDKSTTGVLLLTNDGELTEKLTHPSNMSKKIYHVFLDKNLSGSDFKALLDGINLEDGPMHADSLSYIDEDKSQVGLEIHSGRNRIVRRMFEHLGYKVKKLDRVFFAGLTKKNLRRGQWRFLTEQEVTMLKMGAFE